MAISWMECRDCLGKTPIQRKRGRTRKRGHIKTMWCPWCKRVTQHIEKY